MIDKDGYRTNIGIVVVNDASQVLLARRIGQDTWQLPQGGVNSGESMFDALYRELYEEVGISKTQVKLIAKTPQWLRYDLPKEYVRQANHGEQICIGQKQVWYLIKLICPDNCIKLDTHSVAEFDDWKWVDYWHPIEAIIPFKQDIYQDMLKVLAPVLFGKDCAIPDCYDRPIQCKAIVY